MRSPCNGYGGLDFTRVLENQGEIKGIVKKLEAMAVKARISFCKSYLIVIANV